MSPDDTADSGETDDTTDSGEATDTIDTGEASDTDDTRHSDDLNGDSEAADFEASPTEIEEPSTGRQSDPFSVLESGVDDTGGLDAPLDLEDAGDDVPEDPFEEMAIENVEEDVWSALESGLESPDIGGDARPVGEDHIVDKRAYCQRCPHFTAPPETACTHEGTEIVEVVSTDEFRIRNCPMIGEEGPTFDTSR